MIHIILLFNAVITPGVEIFSIPYADASCVPKGSLGAGEGRGRANLAPSETVSGFGVLQLRVCWFERLHLEVITSKVLYLYMLQVSIYALFILQAKVIRVALLQFELL
jgi:hypothetical protein